MARIRQTRTNNAFLAIWRRLARGEHVPPLRVASEKEATSLRMKFYQVLRPYRHLDYTHPDYDPELQIAADRYAIRANKDYLEFGEKVGEAQADMLIARLGLSEEEVSTEEERMVASTLAGLAVKENPDA